jgi:thiamine-monophosphate kinase
MNKEDFFISCFSSSKIGDDAAVLGDWIVSKDAFFENVHFKREWFSLQELAYKSMLVNISDAIAMNAQPRYVLLAVALPSSLSLEEVRDLHRGFDKAAKEFDCEIIGGDTIANVKIDITITVMSQSNKPLLRKGLKPGHLVAYTGVLGESKKALDNLLRFNQKVRPERFISPKLRQSFVRKSAYALSCGMDISDGLYSDLSKLSKVNKLGYHFFHRPSKAVACSGEEYEMLVAFDPRQRKKIVRIAQAQRLKLTIFAKAKRTSYRSQCKAHHF